MENIEIDKGVEARHLWAYSEPAMPSVMREIGSAGNIMQVDKSELKLDLSYQREEVSEKKVQGYAALWSWALCGVLIVAMRKGGFYVVDGGHRLRAAMLRPEIKQLPCVIFDSESASQEAEIFLAINTHRTAVRPYEKYFAALCANDQTAMALFRIVDECGYEVAPHSGCLNTMSATAFLMTITARSEEHAQRTISLATEICDGSFVRVELLKGLYMLIKNFGIDLDQGKPRKRLVELGDEILMQQIRKRQAYYGKTAGATEMAHGILDAYNHRLRGNRIILGGEISE